MRSIGLLLLIGVVFSWAEEAPPPPHIMLIHLNGGTTDSVLCSRLDPDVGVTFIDNGMKMKVGVRDLVNPDFGIFDQSILWFCTSQIDSITFALIGPPPELETLTEPLPVSTLTKRLAPGK